MSELQEWDAGYREEDALDEAPAYEWQAQTTPPDELLKEMEKTRVVATMGGRTVWVGDPLIVQQRLRRLAWGIGVTAAVVGVGLMIYGVIYRKQMEEAQQLAKEALRARPPVPAGLAGSSSAADGEGAVSRTATEAASFENARELVVAGRLPEALKMFGAIEKAGSVPASDAVQFYRAYGDTAVLAGKALLALQGYEAALRLMGKARPPDLLNNVAFVLMDQGQDLDRAAAYAREALDQEPSNPAYLDTLGCIYFKQRDYDSAARTLKAAAETAPELIRATVYEHLGDAYLALNQSEEAINWWRRAAVLAPTNQNLWRKINKSQEGK